MTNKILNFINRYFWLICLLIIGLTIYSYRFIFFEAFDPIYLKDFYDHSQWSIPFSPRIMGDGELYRYVAYRLVNGAHPFELNPEAPPLGKYFYGLSILLFNNPKTLTPLLFIAASFVFYLITKSLFSNPLSHKLSFLFFITSPILITQIWDTQLDLPQLFCLLIHILAIFKFQDQAKSRLFWSIIAGLSLGAVAATKIGIFVIPILLADIILLARRKQSSSLLLILTIAAFTYLAAYTQFFLNQHSIFEWVKSQLWMLKFYSSSTLKTHFYSFITTLTTGWFRDVYQWKYTSEWTLLWPLSLASFIAFLVTIKFGIKKLSATWQWITIFTFGLSLIYLLLPFATRYLVLLMPFLLLFLVQFLKTTKPYINLIILFISLLQFTFYLIPQPQTAVDQFTERFSGRRYAEAYDYLLFNDGFSIDHRQFTKLLRDFDNQIELTDKQIEFSYPLIYPWQNQFSAILTVTHHTPVGVYQTTTPVIFTKANHQWRLNWDWHILAADYQSGDTFSLQLDEASGGDLITADGRRLSFSGLTPFIYLTIQNATDSAQLFENIKQVTAVDVETLRINAYVLNEYDANIPIAFVTPYHHSAYYQALVSSPAISTNLRQTRNYPDGLITGHYYETIAKIEKEHPEIFPTHGGQIILKKSSGEKIIIFSSSSQNGQDIVLEQNISQLLDEKATLML